MVISLCLSVLSATFQSVAVEIHKRRALKVARKIARESRDQPSGDRIGPGRAVQPSPGLE